MEAVVDVGRGGQRPSPATALAGNSSDGRGILCGRAREDRLMLQTVVTVGVRYDGPYNEMLSSRRIIAIQCCNSKSCVMK